jgi:hypothetical protein
VGREMARNPDISEPVAKGCMGYAGMLLVGLALAALGLENTSLWLLGTIGITVVLWRLYAYGERKLQQSEGERRWRIEAMLHRSAVWDEIECNVPRLEFCAGLSLSAGGGPRSGSGSDLRCNSVGQTSEIFYEVG